jgi:hypothetical protein
LVTLVTLNKEIRLITLKSMRKFRGQHPVFMVTRW